MKVSRYNIFVPLHQNRILAYNGMSGGLAVWEKEDYQTYQQVVDGKPPNNADALRELAKGGYLVNDQIDELAVLWQQYRKHRFDASTAILTIAPTLGCNFNCDYCFQGQDKPQEAMSQEVQDALFDMAVQMVPWIKHLHVAWYGGEPLLRKSIIESLSERFMHVCDSTGVRYDAMMVTNGYLLNAETAKSLYQRRVKQVQITLDGMADYHDTRRTLLTGKGTFQRIIDNVKEWIDDVPLGVSVRINIDDRNRENIHGLIDDLAAQGLANKKNFKLYFAPVEAMTEGCHIVADVTMQKSRYADLETNLFRYAFEKGLTSLPYPPRFRGTCGAVRPRGFVVVPNGDIHKCWDTVSWPEKRIGTVFKLEDIRQDEQAMKWMKWNPFENDTCRNCKILPNCAGACAFKFVHAEETRGEAAILPCPSWKYNIKERLVLRALKMGAITSDDYDFDAVKTNPAQLCADVHIPGKSLPDKMKAAYAVAAK
ncbi:MAG: radical SAM/SPASM domain protein maturase [Okeania sp. SIO2C9]|uniref:TIGR04463 family radical SAM/SPASM RiPP maturase n=1 Tax=Okeania sp. SIO2C9 TaxID=2607791 RepID=UPI0013C155B4|nr:TIGR04463 family radical SAM/SPASM RiPP maturase [Okeania sp. SIO2C9]NEQ72840.1 radical SAM/SPASM domain protein maturase [Okeania sp. SIO2C9]